ncbi:MAG: ankyrin repeat domain-containing protein [Streptococcus sp.]|nr:ankyrin repeat domain-containing protein [Streptococcus sp.]
MAYVNQSFKQNSLDLMDNLKNTPLHLAARNGHSYLVKALIDP